MNAVPQARRRSAWGLVAILLASAVVASACTSVRSPPAGEPSGAATSVRVTSLRDLSELRDRFNEDAGEVRLVLLLSPT